MANHVEQAASQEAEHEALAEAATATASEPVETAPKPMAQPCERAPASSGLTGTKEAQGGMELPNKAMRRKFTDRLVTRLSTRGAMTRTLGSDEPVADAAGKLPSPTTASLAKRS